MHVDQFVLHLIYILWIIHYEYSLIIGIILALQIDGGLQQQLQPTLRTVFGRTGCVDNGYHAGFS